MNEFEEKLLKILNLFKSKILCTENIEILENFNKLEKNVHTYLNLLGDELNNNNLILNSLIDKFGYINNLLFNKNNINNNIITTINQIIGMYSEQLELEIEKFNKELEDKQRKAVEKVQITSKVINEKQKSEENIKKIENNIFSNIEVQKELNEKLERKKKEEEEQKRKEEEKKKRKEEEKKIEEERKRKEEKRRRESSYSEMDTAFSVTNLIMVVFTIMVILLIASTLYQAVDRKSNRATRALENTMDSMIQSMGD